MAASEFVVAVTGAILAAAALLFAILQTASALSQYLASMNRCGRAITGAFELRQGFFWSLLSLTLNPRYRMPVLTMPGLRSTIPIMEHRPIENTLHYGQNFDETLNSYMDRKTARVTGPQRALPISYRQTIWALILRIAVCPFLLATFPLSLVLCIPCLGKWVYEGASTGEWDWGEDDSNGEHECGGFSLGACALCPFLVFPWLFKGAIKRKTEAQTSTVTTSSTPGLEAACWVQFLMNYQATWWGHANLRWEWRLASLIPADLYGASAETTMADVQLLAVLGGMHFSDNGSIIGRTLCGEQLTVSQHSVLGTTAYYRSGRENVRAEIELSDPMRLGWLLYSVEARRMAGLRRAPVGGRYKNQAVALSSHCNIDAGGISDLSAERVVRHLARRRTIYDAQLSYSCGDAIWTLWTQGFQTYAQTLLERPPQQNHPIGSAHPSFSRPRQTAPSRSTHQKAILSDWNRSEVGIFWGPLGSGINSCSCMQCCRDWINTATSSNKLAKSHPRAAALLACGGSFWPALEIAKGPNGVSDETVGPTVDVPDDDYLQIHGKGPLPTVEILVQACCTGNNALATCCGTLARLIDESDAASFPDQVLAVVALNTRWLAKVESERLRLAAEELVFGHHPSIGQASTPDNIETIKNVIAYTEKLLLLLRQHIGSANVWDSPLGPPLEDFSPIALGA
ncbi:uncharacterized protein HMPREF1541_06456 [Cyphellophora europaea CBS 101466]|uniref:Uncharacterized protein n=1 Tax=Cyphellophora europaea (strain CBS 101466) TaxID=1220924 RepID=W2RPJ1_CYPE1|nr:uncharacterized protein HMPREF1541_06456 [Cyphellophora europaea CBS 101466]ETN38421.1 hypothetical protein HMPREF1541_06456 [Cyphellophora europaea CBS 101466]